MDPSEATLARERCAVHQERSAVGRCERCGRTVCLECAVPFRESLRCERCAALELGEPAPAPAERRLRLRGEHGELALLLVAGAATIPPWHRSGTLTSPLSAWSFTLDGWAALSCVTLAAALVLVLLAVLRPSVAVRAVAAGSLLSAVSAIAVGIALARAPGFFSSTAASFVVLVSAIAAAAMGAFLLLRRARP